MEYDPFSPEFQADPFPVYRWMLEEAPVLNHDDLRLPLPQTTVVLDL